MKKTTLALVMHALAITTHAGTLVVNNAAPNAADTNPGTDAQPFKTINAAAQIAKPGDTVFVRAGTYRERVSPAQSGTETAPIVYTAAPGERVEIKGSECWKNPWTPDPQHPRVFASRIDTTHFRDAPNPYAIGISIAGGDPKIVARPVAPENVNAPWPRTLGQIFVNGEPLTQVESVALLRDMEGAWMVSADGAQILVHLPGAQDADILLDTVEWSVRNRIFAPRRRGLAHITVRGFTFLHCANQGPFPQGGAVSTRTGRNWIFEENTIRFAKTVGLDVGSEYWDGKALGDTDEADKRLIIQAGHIVRNNTISDNGLCGIAGWNSPDVRIYNNLLDRNNRLSFSGADAGWEEWAAIKLHNSNAVIAGNIIRFNEAHGIWIDNGYNLSRITGNVLIGNCGSGIMLELGAGTALIDNNIVAQTRPFGGFYDGNAVYAHDASGLTVVHNLFTDNAGAGVLMRTITGRTYGGAPVNTSDATIRNNIFHSNRTGTICIPFANPRAQNNVSDYNVFIGDATTFRLNKYQDAFKWEDVAAPEALTGKGEFRTLDADTWRAATGWDKHSAFVKDGGFGTLPYRMLMRANIPEEIRALRFPAVDEMTCDFHGTPMASDAFVDNLSAMYVLPGPLQNMAQGKSEISLVPYRFSELPTLRLNQKTRAAQAGAHKIIRAQDAVTPQHNAATQTLSLRDALQNKTTSARWSHGTQKDADPSVTAPLADRVDAPTDHLHTQSTKGVSASPAKCLLLRVPEAARYDTALSVALEKRGSASAGFTVVELYLLDDTLTTSKLLWRTELNTPDGYRGNELSAAGKFHDTVVCPEGFHLMLRFQVVAPGPAVAGNATLRINDFTLRPIP